MQAYCWGAGKRGGGGELEAGGWGSSWLWLRNYVKSCATVARCARQQQFDPIYSTAHKPTHLTFTLTTSMLSYSTPFVQAKGAKMVSVASVQGCRLEHMCDLAVHLPLERELCPFDLAPVTSTAIQMLFGDTVAIALMQVPVLTQQWAPY